MRGTLHIVQIPDAHDRRRHYGYAKFVRNDSGAEWPLRLARSVGSPVMAAAGINMEFSADPGASRTPIA